MHTKLMYTVCSANHLAYAKTMADSFLVHNPDYKIIIGLADKINNRFDTSYFFPHNVVEIELLNIHEYEAMTRQYNVIEFNCAVKPFLGQYLFKKYNPEILIYLDSDIFIYNSFTVVEQALDHSDILLTPHFTTPINDGFFPYERGVINSGLYNAGFVAMKRSETTDLFLSWWADRLKDQCYYNYKEGMGVDQTWLNFVPLFFSNVGLFNNKGANVAYWNLHERAFSESDGKIMINKKDPLLFLHISGYNLHEPDNLSKHQNRHSLKDFPLLDKLFSNYREKVFANKYDAFSALKWEYAKPKKKQLKKLLYKLNLKKLLSSYYGIMINNGFSILFLLIE